MVEITSSVTGHSIIPAAEYNTSGTYLLPPGPLWHKSLGLWPSPFYSLATCGVYQQRRPRSAGAARSSNNNKLDEGRQLGLEGQRSFPMRSPSQPAVLLTEVKGTRAWTTLSKQKNGAFNKFYLQSHIMTFYQFYHVELSRSLTCHIG